MSGAASSIVTGVVGPAVHATAGAPADTVLVLAGRDGTVHFCNPAAARQFGLSLAVPDPALPIWDWFSDAGARQLRHEALVRPAGASSWLVLRTRRGGPMSCQLEWFGRDFLLLQAADGRGQVRGRPSGNGRQWLERQRLALAGALEAMHDRNAELARLNARLQVLAQTDTLTGLCNRHHFEEVLDAEIGRVRRTRSTLCAVMVDLDRFKSVNDRLGHEAGDAVLVAAARALRAGSRPYDIVARYGGEEFVLLLPDTVLRAGAECAERLRRAIESGSAGSLMPVTASLGVAALAPEEGKGTLLRRADMALYRAKQRGRNRVECEPAEDPA